MLGPLLFIIYTNDLPNAIANAKSILFADDTTLYASSDSLSLLYKNINSDLSSLADWFCANKLSLNVGKTNYILFSRKHVDTHLEVTIGNTKIERKPFVKFLGIIVDQTLDWSEHVKSCKAKLSSSLYALNASKRYLTSRHLLMLYNALLYPYLSYGVLLWGSTFQTHLNKIVVMQKRAVRIIAHAPYNAHTEDIFQQYHLLKFQDIYHLYLGKYMFSQINDILPEPLLNRYTQCRQIHTHNTRQVNQLHKQSKRTVLVANSFIHRGLDYWNKLPKDFKESITLTAFNKRHKMHLLNS